MKVLNVVSMLNYGGTGEALASHVRDIGKAKPNIVCDIAVIHGNQRISEIAPFVRNVINVINAEQFSSIITKENYDVIHWWRSTPDKLFSKVVHNLPANRAPIILTLCQIPVNARYGLTNDEMQYSDIIVFICKAAYDHPSVRWLGEKSRRMIYFGITAFPYNLKSDVREHEKRFVFGRGSTLNKCPKDMLRVFKDIPIPDAKFLIAGKGDSCRTEFLERQIKKEKLKERVKMVGQLNRPEWIEFLQGLDVFLYHLPKNIYSAIDGTVQDAMLSELPVVLLNGDGPRELVLHGESGFIAENKQEFIRYCVQLYEDAFLRERIGKAARQRILKNFRRENTIKEYADLYEECAASNSARFPDGRVRKLGIRRNTQRFIQLLCYLPFWTCQKLQNRISNVIDR